ncbi:Asp23/Gls24 family envelope stress response protein [Nocardia sp. CDC159]|uniref:Asp23/Gls24 family envelope stress response protein n=1 Tax=Nocardia pulmonis TaxID=2951408 RepID=A0A9X2EBV9_9NOCA|nr:MULTISPECIES: Asp23/Gls24 family envelope stress response protein [Nocardia]MCM6776343.1 Asp23/Gls24 family envelope stress response protein [Nocardia pulmonis]MCM6788767.1 Asp23/Gls24 family envelope stress response protein [Nocardia sp. CDC159]
MTTVAAAELPGRTTVGERAVRRIAARAAREVDGVGPDVRVSARVDGDTATLNVALPIRYPMPIGQVAARCRAHLIERTRELAGLTVPRVDIEVSALPIAVVERRVR